MSAARAVLQMSLRDRLLHYAYPEPNTGCWLWTGGSRGAYGSLSCDGQRLYAHRASYETFKGPIPPGFEPDHLCFMQWCINPDHLEAVPRSVNVRRYREQRWKARPRCAAGHLFS